METELEARYLNLMFLKCFNELPDELLPGVRKNLGIGHFILKFEHGAQPLCRLELGSKVMLTQ